MPHQTFYALFVAENAQGDAEIWIRRRIQRVWLSRHARMLRRRLICRVRSLTVRMGDSCAAQRHRRLGQGDPLRCAMFVPMTRTIAFANDSAAGIVFMVVRLAVLFGPMHVGKQQPSRDRGRSAITANDTIRQGAEGGDSKAVISRPSFIDDHSRERHNEIRKQSIRSLHRRLHIVGTGIRAIRR
jgi:hypothetical protein